MSTLKGSSYNKVLDAKTVANFENVTVRCFALVALEKKHSAAKKNKKKVNITAPIIIRELLATSRIAVQKELKCQL